MLRGEDEVKEERGNMLLLQQKIQAVWNVFLSSQSWSGESDLGGLISGLGPRTEW